LTLFQAWVQFYYHQLQDIFQSAIYCVQLIGFQLNLSVQHSSIAIMSMRVHYYTYCVHSQSLPILDDSWFHKATKMLRQGLTVCTRSTKYSKRSFVGNRYDLQSVKPWLGLDRHYSLKAKEERREKHRSFDSSFVLVPIFTNPGVSVLHHYAQHDPSLEIGHRILVAGLLGNTIDPWHVRGFGLRLSGN
jgi:hypothetical protein